MLVQSLEAPVLYLLIAVMIFNLSQRSHIDHGEGKRFATLYLAGLLLLLHLGLLMIGRIYPAGGGSWILITGFLVFGGIGFLFRRKIFPFRLTCSQCGARLPVKTILYYDDNLCAPCRSKEEALVAGDPLIHPPEKNLLTDVPRKVEKFDWEAWEPSDTAVVCYIFSEDKVLLIDKKRGLGRGKVNAPGGRMEPGETPRETAVREVQEEVGLTISKPREVGKISFVFTNGYSLKGHVFFADTYRGKMTETDEARPFWVPLDQIPYDQMWEDDIIWLPRALDGAYIDGRFIFEDDRMISYTLEESTPDK